MRVVVLGAGVVGVTSAYYLARKGLQVTVVDWAHAVASGASFANGGQLSYSFTDALARPGMLRKLPGLLLGRDPAISMHLSPDSGLLRWGLHFVSQCTTRNYEKNTAAVLQLALQSSTLLDEIRKEFAFDFSFRKAGKLVLLRSSAEVAAARKSTALKNHYGCKASVLAIEEACEVEPSLHRWRGRYVAAVYSADDHVGDVQAFCAGLAQHLEIAPNVNFRLGCEARSLLYRNGRVSGVKLEDEVLEAEAVVVCLGARSPQFLRNLRPRQPIVPVRGYSVTLPPGPHPPQASISDVEHRLVFTVLGCNVRIAGFADFVGFTDDADASRIRTLMDIAREIAPDAADYSACSRQEWGGFRPMTANSQPLLGPGAVPGLYLNCGHGMLGWTLACASAYRIANAIAG